MDASARVRRAPRRHVRWCLRGGLATALLLPACAASEIAPDTQPPAAAEGSSAEHAGLPPAAREFAAHDAQTVLRFAQACAACHGLDGSGSGPLVLERPARDLRGGFSFGNTTEAIARTIVSGIPGTPMPAFGESLAPEAIAALAAYVQALGPPPRTENDQPSELTVADRSAVVRGLLPPIAQGALPHPRGLLVGLPGGLSFEYRADDLALLGVRFGRFVQRTDWRDRGGTPLQPLGRLVLAEPADGQGLSSWKLARPGAAPEVLRTQLLATRSAEGGAQVLGELLDPQGRCVARLTESLQASASGRGLRWTRNFTLTAVDWAPGEELHLLLADPRDSRALPVEKTALLPRDWLPVSRRALGSDSTVLAALRRSGSANVELERLAPGCIVRLSRPDPGDGLADGNEHDETAAATLELVTLLVSGSADAATELLAEGLP